MPGEPWLMASAQKKVKSRSKCVLYTFTEKPCLTAEQVNRCKPMMDDSNNSLTLEERKNTQICVNANICIIFGGLFNTFRNSFQESIKVSF